MAYLAPGLLAGTCMQIGTNDATYPVMGAIKWMRTYFAQLATPLEVYDVLLGHLAWIAARLAIVVSIYLARDGGIRRRLLALGHRWRSRRRC